MRPRKKNPVLLIALLLIFFLVACKKEDPIQPGSESILQKRFTTESLIWVFEKDTNLATSKFEIPSRFSMANIELVIGLGDDPFSQPIRISEYTADSSEGLYYKISGRQLEIYRFYSGTNFWDQAPKSNSSSDSSILVEGTFYYVFFVWTQIGITSIQVNFK